MFVFCKYNKQTRHKKIKNLILTIPTSYCYTKNKEKCFNKFIPKFSFLFVYQLINLQPTSSDIFLAANKKPPPISR
jgi:hypothetical protein